MTEHKNIYAAIAAAVGEIKQLGKTDRNKFDGYDFVSIDKFLKMVNPICAAHGLFPSISMTDCQLYENVNSKGGKSTWARFYYDISLHHATGETFGPHCMMVAVPMNGAQASGSAQSYALKQFFRGTFMIPTGDKDDADLNATEDHAAPAPRQQKPARTIPDQAESEAVKYLNGAESLQDLQERWGKLPPSVKTMPDVVQAKDARKAALQSPITDDQIPY
jgi:hypothetical protein